MSVTIELRPEIEADLAAQAAAHGLPLPAYLQRLIEAQASTGAGSVLSPAQRAAAWRESVKDLPHTPPLSDEAIARESIYDARG